MNFQEKVEYLMLDLDSKLVRRRPQAFVYFPDGDGSKALGPYVIRVYPGLGERRLYQTRDCEHKCFKIEETPILWRMDMDNKPIERLRIEDIFQVPTKVSRADAIARLKTQYPKQELWPNTKL